jgi:hypothetical protein
MMGPQNRTNHRRQARMVFALLLGVLCAGTGCATRLATSMELRSLPTFDEVRSAWPQLAADRGRIVFYYPRDKGRELGKLDSLPVEFQGRITALSGGTFIYGDYPPGAYALLVGKPKEEVLTLSLAAADTLYVELGPDRYGYHSTFSTVYERIASATATLVSREDALSHLSGMRSITGNAAGWHLFDPGTRVKKP